MLEDGRDAGIECMVFHFLFLFDSEFISLHEPHFSQNFVEAGDVKYLGAR